MKTQTPLTLVLGLLAGLWLAASAQAFSLADISGKDASGGLKEALTQGAGKAVDMLGKTDGFLGNPKVKIPLPGYLQKAESGLRMFGMGKQADQLISARTPVAERVELHQMQMDNNVMKMRAVPAIELPAQAELRMMHGSADGYHLMLINLKQPLKDGDRFSVWLQFKNSGEREVTVHVQTPKNSAPAHDHHH